MEIGTIIRQLQLQKDMTQEDLAEILGVSVQTVSRWENQVNYPDLVMLPQLAALFHVTTDYLLGVKGETQVAKLLTTREVFQCSSRTEAEAMVKNFQNAPFPKLLGYTIQDTEAGVILTAEKEFNAEFDKMRFD